MHDIRRSFVTLVSEHGFAQPHVIEAIVNHISGAKAGVAGVYNKATYLNERRRALDLWGQHIAALVAGRIAPCLANPDNRALIKPEALWEVDQATNLSGAQLLGASVQRSAFHQQMLRLFERCDVLALPTAQVWPFDAGLRWPTRIAGRDMDTYHRWMEVTIYATFAGLPCISVPVGFTTGGLPAAMQLVGRPFAEATLLGVAATYQRLTDWHERLPPVR